MGLLPKYPIYVPTKGRVELSDAASTLRFLREDKVPHFMVVEPQEADEYAKRYGRDTMLILPFSNRGTVVSTRNWILDHSRSAGDERHWQLDDNIRRIRRWHRTQRIACNSGPALRACEDFTDRYTNVGLSGLNYTMFAVNTYQPPFVLNAHVYSITLMLNSLPYRFREPANEDVDMCLQVLTGGWCTILFNAFLAEKVPSMTIEGGNTKELYDKVDARLEVTRSLQRKWPHVVETKRRFSRPQHVIKNAWKKFDTQLIRRDDIDFENLKPNEYGLKLKQVGAEIKSKKLKSILREAERTT